MTTLLLQLLYLLSLVSITLGAAVAPTYLTLPYQQKPSSTIVPETGSSTPVGAVYTHTADAPYTAQGVCHREKDLDGSGYSYWWMNNGQRFDSLTSCE